MFSSIIASPIAKHGDRENLGILTILKAYLVWVFSSSLQLICMFIFHFLIFSFECNFCRVNLEKFKSD